MIPFLADPTGIVFFLGVLLVIALSNQRALRRLSEYPLPPQVPHASILVPARNEEGNVGPCIGSLLAQEYPDFEVLVLDDHSTDGTGRILAELAATQNRLRVLSGQALPDGWLGKHWACHQLAEAATGELLLFTDADTRHHPRALRDAVAAMLAERADLLSALPRQEMISWAERLLVPVIGWSIMTILPLGLAHRARAPALSATVGQFMMFRRSAYDQIGGFRAVRDHVADDLALGWRTKAYGLRWRLVDGSTRITCRMYRDSRQAWEGFGKNLFAAFDYRVLPFLFVWLWMGMVFLQPVILLALSAIGFSVPDRSIALAAVAVILSLVVWSVTCRRLVFPLYLPLIYPAIIGLWVILALRSMVLALMGRGTWKGRVLAGQKVHWI